MNPVPWLFSFAAACYMGAIWEPDSGTISYGSSIHSRVFLDSTGSKMTSTEKNGEKREQVRTKKKYVV